MTFNFFLSIKVYRILQNNVFIDFLFKYLLVDIVFKNIIINVLWIFEKYLIEYLSNSIYNYIFINYSYSFFLNNIFYHLYLFMFIFL